MQSRTDSHVAYSGHLHSQWFLVLWFNDGIVWQFTSWLCWLPLKDLGFCCPTVASCPLILILHSFRLILISNHFVLMTDDANGFRLNHQRHDFQDVHYVVHGRESSATIIWPNDPAAAVVSYDADFAVAEMILLILASFSLALRVHASPVFS